MTYPAPPRIRLATAPRAPLLLGLLLALAGCGDTLVFAERSGVNLGTKVDPASSQPLEVNAGVKRQVVTVIPPMGKGGDGSSAPNGEAVNMFSQFEVSRELRDGNFNDVTTIRNRFASGGAALAISSKPDAVVAIIRPTLAQSKSLAEKLAGCSDAATRTVYETATDESEEPPGGYRQGLRSLVAQNRLAPGLYSKLQTSLERECP
jgi:hypothetical protein